MGKIASILLALVVAFSCGNNKEISNTTKTKSIEVKEQQQVKEEVKKNENINKVEDIRPGLITIKTNDGKLAYYSTEQNKILTSKDILRYRFKRIIYSIDKNIDTNDINFNIFSITKDTITFGTNKKLTLNLEKFKNVFKANIGLPSIYEGSLLVPKPYKIDPTKKHIAFTFDDGPANENHIKIRELFTGEDRATFCFVGRNVVRNPDMVRDTYLSGNLIADHSFNHPPFAKLNEAKRWMEFEKTSNAIMKITGFDVDKLRLPYGSTNADTNREFKGHIAIWNVDSLDWKLRDKDKIIAHVMPDLKDGKIVLFHDLYPTSYEAVEYLYHYLKDQGFQFVTYDDMVKINREKREINKK